MAAHGHSDVEGYKEKGDFVDVNGTKVYATGPATAKTAILIVYDIFGFSSQILQGADILAHADDEHHQYRVYMPDFLKGTYASHSWIPPDTEEKQKALGDFFKSPANAPEIAAKVEPMAKELAAKFPGVEQWAGLGYCWGGKVVALSSQSGSVFKAAAEVHPAMVDENDAKGISIPFCMLASKDEPKEDVQKFEKALSGPKHVETFPDQIHGWLAARADLSQESVKKEYQRGYKVLLDFL